MEPLQGSAKRRRVALWRVPLVPAAGAMAAGIAAGRFAPLPTGFWAALAAAALVVGVATFVRKRLHLATALAVGVTIAALGAVHVRLAYFHIPDDHVVTYTARQPILATLRGRVVTSPQIIADRWPEGMNYPRRPRTSFVLRAESLHTSGGWRPVSGGVRVTIEEPAHDLAAGQELELVGRLGRPRGPDNPGQYDWAQAERNKGLLVRMTVPAADGASLLPGSASCWSRALWRARAAARQHWLDCGDPTGGQLLSALVIGERHPALRKLNRVMMRAGIAHFLSISGLHLGVFLGFVYLLCRLATLAPRRAASIVLGVLVAYLLLAEARPPLLRSAIMAAMLCLATILQRRYVALNGIAAAAVILLAFEPLQLFQPGFQLSFAIVAGLLVLYEPMRRLLFGRWLRVRGLMVFRGDDRFRRWLYYTAGDWGISAVTLCLTAYLVAAPLVAYHFGLFSPYAPLLSLLLFPLILAVLIPGYLSIALAWPMPNLSYALGRLGGRAADALAWAISGLENLPGLSFELRPVGTVWVLLCYAAVGLILIARRVRLGRLWAGCAAAAVVAATVYTQLPARKPDVAELNVLAVGAGQCVILRAPSGRTVLFDAGSMSGTDVYGTTLGPFLRGRCLPAPTAAFVSHANADHYNALPGLLRRGSLSRVYLNERFGAPAHAVPAVADLMGQFARGGVEVRRLSAGMVVDLDERTRVEVLWPRAGAAQTQPTSADEPALSANESSLVLRVTCDGKTVLLPGDIEEFAQTALAQPDGAVRADVLILPHHGGWKPSLSDFVAAVAPKIVITSAARAPRAPGEPDEPPQQFHVRLRTSYRYYATPRNGWIQVRFEHAQTTVKTMR